MRDHYLQLMAQDDEARLEAIEMSRYEEWLDEEPKEEDEDEDWEQMKEDAEIAAFEAREEQDEQEYMSINW